MNKETYEALKRIVEVVNSGGGEVFRDSGGDMFDIKAVESWIDEVAKEYTEEEHTHNWLEAPRDDEDDEITMSCPTCGATKDSDGGIIN
jgi:hypothetical protein